MANSNRKKARKLQEAKQTKKAESAKKAKFVKQAKAETEKPIKYTVTAEQLDDGTFKFQCGRNTFNITKQKNKALEPYGKCIHNYGVLLELIPGDKQAAINQQIGNARVVHNDYLSKRIDYYNENKKTLTVTQYKKEYLPALKEEKEYLKDTDKFVYENAATMWMMHTTDFLRGCPDFQSMPPERNQTGTVIPRILQTTILS